MFSRESLGNGPRWPLMWLWGPLLLGVVLITAVGIAFRAAQGFPNIELADEVRRAARSGDPLLADTVPFAWDRVCIFPDSVTADDVDERLGFEWGRVGGYPAGELLLFVFVRDEEVVTHFFLNPELIAEPEPGGDCRGPEDESTRL